MKKLLAIILSIAILACCTIAASAEAAEVNVTIGQATVDADGYALIPISFALGSGVDIGSMQMTIGYDASKIAPVSQSKVNNSPDKCLAATDAFAEYAATTEVNTDKVLLQEDNILKIGMMQSDGVTYSGQWYTLKFKVLDGTAYGDIDVTVKDITAGSAVTSGKVWTTASENGKVVYADPDQAKAAEAVALIKDLPAASAVTLDNEASIVAAKAAYDALTDAQKALVPAESLAALNAAVDALAVIKGSSSSSEASGTSSVTSSTSSTGNNTTTNPKTADNSVAFFAAILCAAMAAAFVVTKRVKD